jgi:hypothetical protein
MYLNNPIPFFNEVPVEKRPYYGMVPYDKYPRKTSPHFPNIEPVDTAVSLACIAADIARSVAETTQKRQFAMTVEGQLTLISLCITKASELGSTSVCWYYGNHPAEFDTQLLGVLKARGYQVEISHSDQIGDHPADWEPGYWDISW